jgi:hypothetical protein
MKPALRLPSLLLAMLLAAALPAAELPKIVRDQVETVKPALAKAYADYSKKVQEENNKLVAAIQKAMEKATKAGKLDDALALKDALEKARNGELLKEFLEPTTEDLLGTTSPTTDALAVVTLSLGNPVAALAANLPFYDNRDYLISEVSKELQGLSFVQRSFKEPGPCTVKVVKGGILYLVVGVPGDGLDLEKLGFAKTDLHIKAATGEFAVVKKVVKAGETIELAPTATTSTVPIWKAK